MFFPGINYYLIRSSYIRTDILALFDFVLFCFVFLFLTKLSKVLNFHLIIIVNG